MNTSTSNLETTIFHLVYRVLDVDARISTCIHEHPGMPRYKKHNRLSMSSILHLTDFAFFSVLQRIGCCLARARQLIVDLLTTQVLQYVDKISI